MISDLSKTQQNTIHDRVTDNLYHFSLFFYIKLRTKVLNVLSRYNLNLIPRALLLNVNKCNKAMGMRLDVINITEMNEKLLVYIYSLWFMLVFLPAVSEEKILVHQIVGENTLVIFVNKKAIVLIWAGLGSFWLVLCQFGSHTFNF